MLTIPPAVAGTLCLTPAVIARYRTRKIPVTLVDWPVFARSGLSLLAAGTVWQWEAYGNGLLVLVFVPVLLWAAVRGLVRDAQGLQVVAGALFLGGLLAALWGLLAWTSGNGTVVDGVRRLVGPHYSPNHTALYLVRTLFLGLGITLAAARWQRWWLLAATGFVLLALVLTGSRGALLLGLPAGALTFGWLALRRRPGSVRWLHVRKRRLRKGRVRWLLALSRTGDRWGYAHALGAAAQRRNRLRPHRHLGSHSRHFLKMHLIRGFSRQVSTVLTRTRQHFLCSGA